MLNNSSHSLSSSSTTSSSSSSSSSGDAQSQTTMTKRDPNALFTGGGFSFLTGERSIGLSYGYSTLKGKRASMEDFFETKISEVDGQMVAFFAVFDGHGGARTAEYLKNNLFDNLSSHPNFIKDPKSAIVEVFKQTDDNYISEEKGQQKSAGSTASTALLVGDLLLVANVGDSRVVAGKNGSAIPLSRDHKPDRSDERQRIEEAGGFVIWAGTWRVGGVLAVSRAFGDKLLKQFVTAEPEIQEQPIDGVDFIIIASDGLWNVVSNKASPVRIIYLSVIAMRLFPRSDCLVGLCPLECGLETPKVLSLNASLASVNYCSRGCYINGGCSCTGSSIF